MAKEFIHTLLYLLGLHSARTQTSAAERAAVARHASGCKRLAEIGVFEGATTRVIADNMHPEAEFHGIDPFFKGRIGVCWNEFIARREARWGKHGSNIKFFHGFSFDAAKSISGDFDFIFIDGDHSLEGITKDWKDWSVRVQPGAIIALHDSVVPDFDPHRGSLGSVQYYESHIRHDDRFEVVEIVDSLAVLRRKQGA
ncbi:MAG: hypothetical protein CMO80_09300 [Verrucomicrobiales bacterium]|nr:hypothetical protein [Verrucomicrobiales bacterium]|tara:strand:+ start:1399 stop:1992 length:594 start_codon:yes stop_codon:yes gene_type:complete